MIKKTPTVKHGLAMTQAYGDSDKYISEFPLEEKSLPKKLNIKDIRSENKDLKKTVKINKEIIGNLLTENDGMQKQLKVQEKQIVELKLSLGQLAEELSHLNDKWLILDQIKNFHESNALEIEEQCEDRIRDIIEQLDRKEYVMQVKESKWGEIEKIMAIYTKSDVILREQLQELKYLCDDTSSGRGISSVVKENEILKEKLEAAESEIDNLMAIIQDLNKSMDDKDNSLDEIIEESSSTSGWTGGNNFEQVHFKIPKLNLGLVSDGPDCTDYKQLCKDQLEVINDLERANKQLHKNNNKLVYHLKQLKTKNVKYKVNALESVNRMKVVKKKLEEYEGLNKSVFDTINVEERAMKLRDLYENSEGRSSILSNNNSDFGSMIIGGRPQNKFVANDQSFGNDEMVYAATGSSSNHRRAMSKPYIMKQQSEVKQLELTKLKRELELCDRRRPQFGRMNSEIQGLASNNKIKSFKSRKGDLFVNVKHQPSDLSEIRYPSERRWESPIDVNEIFNDESF